jgi:hypothetical protein
MTRSTKKPYFTDTPHDTAKKQANRKVRKAKDVPSGASFKKESCSYDIRDWSFHAPKDKKAHRK